MRKEHKEYLKIIIAIISLWVVHKLINHQHNEFFEGAANKKDDEPVHNSKKDESNKLSDPPPLKIEPSIISKPDPPGTNAPQSEPLFTEDCPWYKKIIGGCGIGEIEVIEEPNLEPKDQGMFDNLF